MGVEGAVNRQLRQLGLELFRADPGTLGYGRTQTRSMRNTVLGALASRGYGVRRTYDRDVPAAMIAIAERARPYTMTSPRSVIGLCEAIEYVVRNQIPGAVVECGVWRGGSMIAAALSLQQATAGDRDLYLFDTFAGMPMPDRDDVSLTDPDEQPLARWQSDQRDGRNTWAYAPLDEVRANVLSTGYPSERVHLIKGRIEETIPGNAPESIALLRLDTDWYSSTRHELEHLYPRLARRGVLIVDDYGAWAGARKAVQEYPPARKLFLARVDGPVRIAIKPS